MNSFSVLRNASYRKLFFGIAISKLGDWFFIVSLPLLVYQMTHSAISMALTFVLEILPQVIFVLIGGALADQLNKKKLLIFGDLTSAFIASLIPLLYFMGFLEVWMVYVVAFLMASITAFYHPSFEALLPQVLEKEQYVQGNSLLRLMETVMTFAGPAVAGIAIAMVGNVNTLLIDSASFLITALIVSTIRYTFIRESKDMPNIMEPIKEGIRFVVGNRTIMQGSLFIFGVNIGFGAVESLIMFYMADQLKLSSGEIGFILSLQAAGPFLAVYLANRLKGFARGHVIVYSGFIIGVAQILLFTSHSFVLALLLCQIAIKCGSTLLAINWFTLRQEIVPSELLGRVVSSTRMIAFLAIPFSGMVAGLLANVVNVTTIFMVSGIVVVLCSLWGLRDSLVVVSRSEVGVETQA